MMAEIVMHRGRAAEDGEQERDRSRRWKLRLGERRRASASLLVKGKMKSGRGGRAVCLLRSISRS